MVQLLLDRDPHGNVQVAKIETEVLLAHTVESELDKLAAEGEPVLAYRSISRSWSPDESICASNSVAGDESFRVWI